MLTRQELDYFDQMAKKYFEERDNDGNLSGTDFWVTAVQQLLEHLEEASLVALIEDSRLKD